jgi:hypothetical protein
LIALLSSGNRWWRETARRVLGDRKDRSVAPRLLAMARGGSGRLALEALWALNLSGGFDETAAGALLDHREPDVRRWTVRLLGDERRVSAEVAARLSAMARSEPDVEVRSQLASSARRLPAADGLPIVRGLLGRSEDAGDIHLPLLLWWAIEAKVDSDRDRVLALFDDRALWSAPLVETHLLERLMRRLAQAGTRRDLADATRLLGLAPTLSTRNAWWPGWRLPWPDARWPACRRNWRRRSTATAARRSSSAYAAVAPRPSTARFASSATRRQRR